jgi:hypothetical protein
MRGLTHFYVQYYNRPDDTIQILGIVGNYIVVELCVWSVDHPIPSTGFAVFFFFFHRRPRPPRPPRPPPPPLLPRPRPTPRPGAFFSRSDP